MEKEATQASMFDMITNAKYHVNFKSRSDGLRNEIHDLV